MEDWIRGGTNPNFFWPGWFQVPFVITTTLRFSFSPKTPFDPPYQGSEKTDPPIIWRKMKIMLVGCLIAEMKRFDALITTQKNLSSLRSPISEKIKKNHEKWSFLKNGHFWRIFLIFSETGLRRELRFLAL